METGALPIELRTFAGPHRPRDRADTTPTPREVNTRSTRKSARRGWLTGLEPATSGATVRRSNRLSYNHHAPSLACANSTRASISKDQSQRTNLKEPTDAFRDRSGGVAQAFSSAAQALIRALFGARKIIGINGLGQDQAGLRSPTRQVAMSSPPCCDGTSG